MREKIAEFREGIQSRPSFFVRAPLFILIATTFLLPIFFVPTSLVIFSLGKIVPLSLAIIASFILWVFARLKEGEFTVPRSALVGSIFLVVLVYFVSAAFSDSVRTSLMGTGFEVGTASTVLLLALLMLLVTLVFRTRERLFYLYLAFFASLAVVGLFQVGRAMFGEGFLGFGVLTSSVSNLVGKWNDLGVFFGASIVLSMITLELLSVSRGFKALLYVGVAVSLFFVGLINFTALWVAIGIFGFIFFVYLLSSSRGSEEKEGTMTGAPQADFDSGGRRISGISVAVIVVSLVFVISGGTIGNFLSGTFNINQIEARPSWGSTFEVAREVLSEKPLFGTGPNRFSQAWLSYKPDGINNTIFWSVDFNSGIGFMPSELVTVGAVGTLLWILFLALFVFMGFRAMFSRVSDDFSHYLIVSSFLVSLFLWSLAFVYVPNIVIFALAFIFTGVFVGALIEEGAIGSLRVRFLSHPAINFVSVLVSILVIVLSVVAGYFISQRFVASTFFQRGIVAFNAEGDIEKSQREILRAINLENDDTYYRALTETQIALLNSTLSETGTSEDILRNQFQRILAGAIQSAQAATQIDPTDYRNWISLGRVYEVVVPLQIEGAYENAKDSYEKALELNPRGPAIFLTLARLELANNNSSGAREAIGKALEEKGNYTEAIFLLSQIEISEGNISEAIRSVEAAAILSPNDPVVFFQLGLLRYNDRNYTGAISALENAITLNSVYSNARYFLGLSYEKVGRYEDAVREFEIISELNPDNREVRFILENIRNGLPPFADVAPPLDDEPEAREVLPIEE